VGLDEDVRSWFDAPAEAGPTRAGRRARQRWFVPAPQVPPDLIQQALAGADRRRA